MLGLSDMEFAATLKELYPPVGFLGQFSRIEEVAVELGAGTVRNTGSGLYFVAYNLTVGGQEDRSLVYTVEALGKSRDPIVPAVYFNGEHKEAFKQAAPKGVNPESFEQSTAIPYVGIRAVQMRDGTYVKENSHSPAIDFPGFPDFVAIRVRRQLASLPQLQPQLQPQQKPRWAATGVAAELGEDLIARLMRIDPSRH